MQPCCKVVFLDPERNSYWQCLTLVGLWVERSTEDVAVSTTKCILVCFEHVRRPPTQKCVVPVTSKHTCVGARFQKQQLSDILRSRWRMIERNQMYSCWTNVFVCVMCESEDYSVCPYITILCIYLVLKNTLWEFSLFSFVCWGRPKENVDEMSEIVNCPLTGPPFRLWLVLCSNFCLYMYVNNWIYRSKLLHMALTTPGLLRIPNADI